MKAWETVSRKNIAGAGQASQHRPNCWGAVVAKRKPIHFSDFARQQLPGAIVGAIGAIVSGLAVELIKGSLFPSGPGATGISPFSWIAGILFAGATWRYSWIFSYGAAPEGSRERARFEALKKGLSAGGRIGQAYEAALERVLDRVDRFFGDDGPGVRTLWPHAFGFRGRAPFWTAPAYDRCLTIALAYPIMVMLFIWAVSGHVGIAEMAFGLPAEAGPGRRATVLIFAAMTTFSLVRFTQVRGWAPSARWLTLCILVGAATGLLGGMGIFGSALAVSGSFAVPGIVALALVIPGAGVISVSAQIGLFATVVGGSAAVIASGSSHMASHLALERHRLGLLLLVATAILLVLCFVLARWTAGGSNWLFIGGPMLLFLGLLTLVNAPFDWLTVGLTRVILRRGLELGGWWPFVLALADLLLAVGVIFVLAAVTLLAVQMFDALAVAGGGKPVLDVTQVLAGVADPATRRLPEYWWLYATLFSTLIPSIANLAIGALSVIRGVPGFHRLVAKSMVPGEAMLAADFWMAPALALEVMASIVMAAGVAVLAWVAVFVWLLPALGFGLLPLLNDLAALQLPQHLLGLR
jgi:hypothetical protein